MGALVLVSEKVGRAAGPGIIEYLEWVYRFAVAESRRNKTGTGGALFGKQLTPACQTANCCGANNVLGVLSGRR